MISSLASIMKEAAVVLTDESRFAAKKKKWMQEVSKKQESKGTKGALRAWFGLKKDETISLGMIDKELDKLEKKYPDGGFSASDLKLFRRLQQARRFMEASKCASVYEF